MGLFSKLFDPNAGEIKKLQKIVDKIDSFEDAHRKLSDSELRAKKEEFKRRYQNGETLDQLLPEAYSVVREATYRVTGKRQFRVQMMGGVVLHQGRIAEMKTGEGKTLTATMPAYLNALTGKGVHVVTVNDYLAKFQGEDVGRIFKFLGMTVGVIVHDLAKIDEMDADTLGLVSDYSLDGKLLGHIVRGVVNIQLAAAKTGASQGKALLLQHMVLSHHGIPEYGSPMAPKFPEAEVLNMIDTLDARLYEMDEAISRAVPGGFSEKVWGLDNRLLYRIPDVVVAR